MWSVIRNAIAIAFLWAMVISPALAREEILSFDSEIRVMDTGVLLVRETIRVRVEGRQIKRGIYRDFPVHYRKWQVLRDKRGFEVLEVTRNGAPEPWHTERHQANVRVYIGNKNRNVKKGEQTYSLTYRTDWQLGFFEQHDELYWNVTGNDWTFPIRNITARVTLPESIPEGTVGLEGYSGIRGAKGGDFSAWVDSKGIPQFETTRFFDTGEGLTIVVNWPKGHVHEPTSADRWKKLRDDNADFLYALLGIGALLGFYTLAWLHAGRDPRPGVIYPRYRPQKGYSPAAMRYISRMGYDKKAFACALVNMAVHGHIRIEEDRDGDYILSRDQQTGMNLAPGEMVIMENLLGSSKKIALKPGNSETIQRAIKEHRRTLTRHYEKLYFLTNRGISFIAGFLFLGGLALTLMNAPASFAPGALFMFLWLSIWSVAVAALWISAWTPLSKPEKTAGDWVAALSSSMFALVFTGGEIMGLVMLYLSAGPAVMLHFLLGAAIIACFYQWMKAPTNRGRRMLDKVDGFREYLTLAEIDELQLKNPPEKTPALFEAYLPYAMALDVEEIWGERFAKVFDMPENRHYRPVWYHGDSGFSPMGLGSAISGGLSSAVASSSGSSGSGGGGSSGGGGGGGGGGGW